MKVNRTALLKLFLTLTAIVVIFGSLAKLLGGNSKTLAEYAKEHPQTAYDETSYKETSNTETEKIPNKETNKKTPNKEASSNKTPSADKETNDPALSQTNSFENTSPSDNKSSSLSSLTGASLNKNLMEEERITYQDSFYYEPLSENLKCYITGISYPTAEQSNISYEDLRYLHILHYDFTGNPIEGELICNQNIAQDLAEIFYELYQNEYQLEKVLLIDEYNGDDTASMEDNNTSCFNYRIVEGSSSLSKHALGLAVDINPLYNPYITYTQTGEENIAPVSAQAYADRNGSFPYKIDEQDLCYKLFTKHGFTWGGNWNSSKDYQHFQKIIK